MNMKKKEKHAIRKKSIGVASVLVGTLIGFGLLRSKEADAREIVLRNLIAQVTKAKVMIQVALVLHLKQTTQT